jgi:hypothetical protein
VLSRRAQTVAEYLAELPPDRRAVVAAVRDLVNRHLPRGYAESMGYGMIVWSIPLSRYPNTYNGQPLCYIGLAAQKNKYSLYLMNVYGDSAMERALRDAYAAAARRLDMGKSCLRFSGVEELPKAVIGGIVAATPVEAYLARYEATRAATTGGAVAARKTARAKPRSAAKAARTKSAAKTRPASPTHKRPPKQSGHSARKVAR